MTSRRRTYRRVQRRVRRTTSDPASLDAIARACDRIDQAWRRVHHDPEQLGAIADHALGRRARAARDPAPLAAWLARTAVLPEQLPSGRDSTAITLFHNAAFALEIRHWSEEDLAPHAHAVTGWASVLRGTCLQATYRFAPVSRIGASIQLGALSLVGVEHLSPGSSFDIGADGSQIHAILPLEPVTALICRTSGMPASDPTYRMPALEHAAIELGALHTRQLQMVRMLARLDTDRATVAAIQAVRACDPELAIHLLLELAPGYSRLDDFRPVLDAVTPMRAELVVLTAVFESLFRDSALQRARRALPPGSQRLVCALLALPVSWRQLRAVVRSVVAGPVMAFLVDTCLDMAIGHGAPVAESIRLRQELRALLQRSEREAVDGAAWWAPIDKELGHHLGLPE